VQQSKPGAFSWQEESEVLTVESCARLCKSGAVLTRLAEKSMDMTREAFAAWLQKYGRAWEARDAKAAAELYAEDGTYQITPFVEPMRGRAAILEYWTNVAQTEEDTRFEYEILAVTPEQGIARWRASFVIVPQRRQTKLDGIFVIALDGQGKCTQLREWWHKHQTERG
jgi:uncharacterized protein (TIGR02246 family)